MSAEQLIAAARSFVGTPFRHGGRAPGVGMDCIGVVVCAAAACGLRHRDQSAYSLRPNGQLGLELEAQMVLVARSAVMPGDVLLMAFDEEPHHVAVTTGATIIHAYAQARKCVEQPLSDYWRARVRRTYRFPEFVRVD